MHALLVHQVPIMFAFCLPPPIKIPQRISFTFSFRPSCREDVGVVSAFEGKSFDLFSG